MSPKVKKLTSSKMPLWGKLEHGLLLWFKKQKLESKRLLIACSGGADSQALVHLLSRLASPLKLDLVVASIHHGGRSSARARALKFCKKEAQKLALDFYSLQSPNELSAEAEMRDFRYQALRQIAREQACDFILTAHHADDLLETRLLRLIRGVGERGLPAIATRKGDLIRPLLRVSQRELREWLKAQKISFLGDPTNQDSAYLRNWLRREWLPLLEKRSPGALGALSRSLDLLSSRPAFELKGFLTDGGISQHKFTLEQVETQKQIVLHYSLAQGCAEISSGQIHEILRHLDKREKRHTFKVAGLEWQVNAGQIVAMKLS